MVGARGERRRKSSPSRVQSSPCSSLETREVQRRAPVALGVEEEKRPWALVQLMGLAPFSFSFFCLQPRWACAPGPEKDELGHLAEASPIGLCPSFFLFFSFSFLFNF